MRFVLILTLFSTVCFGQESEQRIQQVEFHIRGVVSTITDKYKIVPDSNVVRFWVPIYSDIDTAWYKVKYRKKKIKELNSLINRIELMSLKDENPGHDGDWYYLQIKLYDGTLFKQAYWSGNAPFEVSRIREILRKR